MMRLGRNMPCPECASGLTARPVEVEEQLRAQEDRITGSPGAVDSWKSGYTGFSAHNAVTVRADDGAGLERLARYLLRPPVSLERLRLEPGLALYRHKRSTRPGGEPFDPA